MRRRPEAIRAEQLIDEGAVAWSPCRATRPASTTSSSLVSRPIAITSVIGISGDAQQAAIRSCPAWLDPVQYNPMRAEEGGHGGGLSRLAA